MKRNQFERPVAVMAIFCIGVMVGCGPAHFLNNSEIPQAKTLGSVMWSQAQLADPAFKKINAAAYQDADWTAFAALGERLQITSAKLTQDFSHGEDWNKLAEALGLHARELQAAANARDRQATSLALEATRATCRGCHKEYK